MGDIVKKKEMPDKFDGIMDQADAMVESNADAVPVDSKDEAEAIISNSDGETENGNHGRHLLRRKGRFTTKIPKVEGWRGPKRFAYQAKDSAPNGHDVDAVKEAEDPNAEMVLPSSSLSGSAGDESPLESKGPSRPTLSALIAKASAIRIAQEEKIANELLLKEREILVAVASRKKTPLPPTEGQVDHHDNANKARLATRAAAQRNQDIFVVQLKYAISPQSLMKHLMTFVSSEGVKAGAGSLRMQEDLLHQIRKAILDYTYCCEHHSDSMRRALALMMADEPAAVPSADSSSSGGTGVTGGQKDMSAECPVHMVVESAPKEHADGSVVASQRGNFVSLTSTQRRNIIEVFNRVTIRCYEFVQDRLLDHYASSVYNCTRHAIHSLKAYDSGGTNGRGIGSTQFFSGMNFNAMCRLVLALKQPKGIAAMAALRKHMVASTDMRSADEDSMADLESLDSLEVVWNDLWNVLNGSCEQFEALVRSCKDDEMAPAQASDSQSEAKAESQSGPELTTAAHHLRLFRRAVPAACSIHPEKGVVANAYHAFLLFKEVFKLYRIMARLRSMLITEAKLPQVPPSIMDSEWSAECSLLYAVLTRKKPQDNIFLDRARASENTAATLATEEAHAKESDERDSCTYSLEPNPIVSSWMIPSVSLKKVAAPSKRPDTPSTPQQKQVDATEDGSEGRVERVLASVSWERARAESYDIFPGQAHVSVLIYALLQDVDADVLSLPLPEFFESNAKSALAKLVDTREKERGDTRGLSDFHFFEETTLPGHSPFPVRATIRSASNEMPNVKGVSGDPNPLLKLLALSGYPCSSMALDVANGDEAVGRVTRPKIRSLVHHPLSIRPRRHVVNALGLPDHTRAINTPARGGVKRAREEDMS